MLEGLTVLDLTDEKGCLCGNLLATLGARVIVVEGPAGNHARNMGPFCANKPGPDMGLFWLAYSSGKLGITLDIETEDGQEIFKKLCTKADVVIESFRPGYMDSLRLGYNTLSSTNPRIILTSITDFGQAGPYRSFKGSDLVDLALGGHLYLSGEPDRPPVRISYPQAYLHAAVDAAVATLVAEAGRQAFGFGQHVDVSVQESVIKLSLNAIPFYEMAGTIFRREGCKRMLVRNSPITQVWPCKDGFIDFMLGGGPAHLRNNAALTAWIDSVGLADEFILTFDWAKLDMANVGQDILDHLEGVIGRAFLAHTKKEIFDATLERGVELMPVFTIDEIVEGPQLEARQYFKDSRYPCEDGLRRWPGAFVKSSILEFETGLPAPRIGEHNDRVYGELLGLTVLELNALKEQGVI